LLAQFLYPKSSYSSRDLSPRLFFDKINLIILGIHLGRRFDADLDFVTFFQIQQLLPLLVE